MNNTRSSTLTIAQHATGTVYEDAQTLITWLPERGDHLGDGVQITAMMVVNVPGDEPQMYGFDAADSDDLQAMIDQWWK